jgi:autotransporter-associated beta strand protein
LDRVGFPAFSLIGRCRRFRRLTPHFLLRTRPFANGFAILTALLIAPQLAYGTDKSWTGTISSTWSIVLNWSGVSVAGSGDNALFDGTFTNQPDAGTTTVGGLWMKTGVGQNVTISGTALTLNGNTINGISNLGILVDNTSSFTLTISAPLTIGNDQAWTNNSGNLITVSGTVDTNGKALTVNGTGNTTISGVISNSGSVTKAGSGTLTLSGANSYTGATAVNGGTLLVSGSIASGSAVTVSNSGTVLGGTGTINGTVTINSGAHLLGGSGSTASGSLTLNNNLTLNSGSIITLALGGSFAHSTLVRTGSGTWSFQSNQAFNFIDLGATTGTYDNIITGLASNPGTGSWTIQNSGWVGTFAWDGANIDLTLTTVPEPETWLSGVLGLVGIGLMQRRRLLRKAALPSDPCPTISA